MIEPIGQASGNSIMHPPEHVVLGSVNHMFGLNHTPLEAMPQNEFIAISPDPCPWFTEEKDWQAVVHGNHLRKRSELSQCFFFKTMSTYKGVADKISVMYKF